MITRLMVALLALYVVSGGAKNWNGLDGGALSVATPSVTSESQASLAKQALDFCLAHRDLCAEAAGQLVRSTGSVPSAPAPVASKLASPITETVPPATTPLLASPNLPVPPRRRGT